MGFRIGIDIDVRQTGTGIGAVTTGLQQLNGVARTTGSALSSMVAPLGLASGLSFAGAAAGLTALVKQGVQFNATMETSRLGIGALVGAFGQVRDSSGRALNDFNANLAIATELQQKLKVAALQTTAEYTDMVTALQVGIGPALKAGFNSDQIVAFTKNVTQAAAAIGLPMNQLGQEIRSLFAGDIGPDSRLANLLFTDIPRNKIKGYIEELQRTGRFYDEMERRMASFALAGEKAGDTFSGALSNLKDAFNQALGEGTQGQFGRLTQLMKDLTSEIVTFDEKGRATFNESFVSGINTVAGAFVGLAEKVAGAVSAVDDLSLRWEAAMLRLQKPIMGPNGPEAKRPEDLNRWDAWPNWIQNTVDRQNNDIESYMAWISSRRALEGARERKGQRDFGSYLFEKAIPGGTKLEGLTAASMIGDLGSLRDGQNAEQVVTRIAKAAKDGVVSLQEFRAALTNVVLTGGGGGAAGAGGKSKKTSIDAELAAMRDQTRELNLQVRVAGERDATKRTSLELEHQTLQLLNKHGAFVQKLAQDEKLTATQRATLAREHLRQTATEIQVERTKVDRQLAESQEKAFNASIDDIAALVMAAHEGAAEINAISAKAWQDTLSALRQPWESFYRDTVGGGLKRALSSALDGGGLRSVFDSFFGSVFESVGENFAKRIDEWTQGLADRASGQKWTGKLNPDGSRQMVDISNPLTQRNAQLGMIGLQSASALYGMYNNPAPKRGQNMLTGAMSGASIGATYGASAFNIYGAVIGAVIGAIAGVFAPTEQGKNVRITGTGGTFSISGLGNSNEWGVDKLQTSINSAIRSTAGRMDAIFTDLPTALLESIGAWRPDLTKIDVTGKGDGKNWNEELENYLKQTLPQRVIDAYMPAVFGALGELGVGGERLTQFAQLLGTQKTEEAIESINNYIDVLAGLQEIAKKFELQGGEAPNSRRRAVGANRFDIFYANLMREAEQGPLGEAGELASRIAALSQGFGDLSHDQQVAEGQKILTLSDQLFGGIEQYLLKLTDMQKSMNDSIDKQIRDINFDQLTDPTQQADFLLAEQRKLRDELESARSEGDITRIVGLMQQNAAELYTLLGRTPEAAEQAKQQLEDVRKIANERYQLIFDKAEDLTVNAFQLVNEILRKLNEGLLNPGAGTGGGGVSNPDDPTIVDPDLPWQKAGLAAGLTAATFSDTLVPSIAAASGALQNLATGATMPQITVVCQHGPTNVDVQLAGTAEPLITSVRAGVTRDTLEAIERRAIRARSTGR